mmetsp:Transcript_30183/g.72624  ORF Transcript_30183/g.72624 Transcript_30183/m.72624 type:complete len:253 (-) Transcript_30183:271-1029(-)
MGQTCGRKRRQAQAKQVHSGFRCSNCCWSPPSLLRGVATPSRPPSSSLRRASLLCKPDGCCRRWLRGCRSRGCAWPWSTGGCRSRASSMRWNEGAWTYWLQPQDGSWTSASTTLTLSATHASSSSMRLTGSSHLPSRPSSKCSSSCCQGWPQPCSTQTTPHTQTQTAAQTELRVKDRLESRDPPERSDHSHVLHTTKTRQEALGPRGQRRGQGDGEEGQERRELRCRCCCCRLPSPTRLALLPAASSTGGRR